jgi:FdhD protein
MNALHPPLAQATRAALRDRVWSQGERAVPEETAIAFVIDGAAEAVMMATPADLEDFAWGFALSEGILATPADLRDLEVVDSWTAGVPAGAYPTHAAATPARTPAVQERRGVELRLRLNDSARATHAVRRRSRMGPAGCGLCGIESLDQALAPIAPIASDFSIAAAEIVAAMASLAPLQTLYQATRAVHAAAFYTPGYGVIALREDVGRHNALDKLIGALARQGRDCAGGVILLTSRVSIELIQKAARAHAPVLAAISAPTALALRAAEAAGVCVCAIVRENGLEVFTRPDRIVRDAD